MPSSKKANIIGIEWTFSQIWEESFRALDDRPLMRRDRIYASELGGSFRDRYLQMFAHPPSNPFNFRSKGKMMAGKFFEDVAAIILTATGLLQDRQLVARVELPNMLPVSGKKDFVAGGVIDWEKAEYEAAAIKKLFSLSKTETSQFVIHMVDKILPHFKHLFSFNPAMKYVMEFKSLSGFVFNLVKSNNKPRRGHDLQLLTYLLPKDSRDIERGFIQYISREDVMLHDIFIERSPAILKEFKKDVATMTEYYNSAGKNYLKNIPPPDPEIIFEDASFSFRKNNLVEYSKYLTYTYGYKNIDHFKEKWDKTISGWNATFKRCVKGDNMTALNLTRMAEAKKHFPQWDKLVAKAKAAGAFEKPEEMEDDA